MEFIYDFVCVWTEEKNITKKMREIFHCCKIFFFRNIFRLNDAEECCGVSSARTRARCKSLKCVIAQIDRVKCKKGKWMGWLTEQLNAEATAIMWGYEGSRTNKLVFLTQQWNGHAFSQTVCCNGTCAAIIFTGFADLSASTCASVQMPITQVGQKPWKKLRLN